MNITYIIIYIIIVMAKIYITVEVEAKDKLDACAKVKHMLNNREDINIVNISTEYKDK